MDEQQVAAVGAALLLEHLDEVDDKDEHGHVEDGVGRGRGHVTTPLLDRAQEHEALGKRRLPARRLGADEDGRRPALVRMRLDLLHDGRERVGVVALDLEVDALEHQVEPLRAEHVDDRAERGAHQRLVRAKVESVVHVVVDARGVVGGQQADGALVADDDHTAAAGVGLVMVLQLREPPSVIDVRHGRPA